MDDPERSDAEADRQYWQDLKKVPDEKKPGDVQIGPKFDPYTGSIDKEFDQMTDPDKLKPVPYGQFVQRPTPVPQGQGQAPVPQGQGQAPVPQPHQPPNTDTQDPSKPDEKKPKPRAPSDSGPQWRSMVFPPKSFFNPEPKPAETPEPETPPEPPKPETPPEPLEPPKPPPSNNPLNPDAPIPAPDEPDDDEDEDEEEKKSMKLWRGLEPPKRWNSFPENDPPKEVMVEAPPSNAMGDMRKLAGLPPAEPIVEKGPFPRTGKNPPSLSLREGKEVNPMNDSLALMKRLAGLR